MKRLPTVLAVLWFAIATFAASHQAVLTWTAPSDAVSATTYNIYRANAVCPTSGIGTLTWNKLTNIPGLTFTDTTITPGSWCYYVTQVQGTVESAPSNTAGGNALPNSPSISIQIN